MKQTMKKLFSDLVVGKMGDGRSEMGNFPSSICQLPSTKSILSSARGAALALTLALSGAAQAQVTLAKWTFETSIPTTGGPLTPEQGSGSATSNTGGTFSNPAGWGSVESWSSNGWDVGEYFQFSSSTTGYQSITLLWQQVGSSTGPKNFELAYSTDGTTFTAHASYALNASSWNATLTPAADQYSYDLSSITSLNNKGTVYFRLRVKDNVSINNGTVASTGTGRIDNFTISGTAGGGGTGPTISSFSPVSGPAGTIVTITGTGFSGATGVNFAGVAASSFTVVSDTQITATVPSAAITGAISVTTGSGTGVSTGSFTVPALTLSLSPTAVNEDAGSSASTGTVSINLPLGTDLTVSLSSGNSAAATVPSSVTILAGQTSATFSVAAVPNPSSFTASTALISASASNHLPASASLTINNVDSSYFELNALGVAKTENFNGMGSSGTADLPLGFKIGTDFSAGTLATTLAYGTAGTGAVTGSSSGGVINWANGTNASSTDRALGFLNTSGYTSPKTIVVAIKNTSGSTINTLDISWNYEKYRSGTRAWDWSFKHGDTSSPTNVLTAGDQSYAADANNTTIFDPPQTTTNKVVKIANLNIAANGIYYLSWTLTGNGASSNGQGLAIDDLSVTPSAVVTPSLGLSVPGSINEGVQGQQGTVTIPQALGTDLTVTLTSSLTSALTVDPTSVTITAGSTSANFFIDTIADNQVTPDRSVTLTATASGYLDATAGVTVKNVDLPRADFGSSGYTNNFSTFTNASSLPLGWSISGNSVAAYSEWPTSTTGTKYNTNAPFLFGFKHTGSTGVVLQTLTLSNSTTEAITALTVTYRGRANTNSGDGRDPSYTVTVAGQAASGLTYSTSEGDNAPKAASVSGLNIAPGAVFTVVWSSDGNNAPGSNTRKTIGLSDVGVAAGVTVTAPTLGSVTVDPFTLAQTSGTVIGSVTSDGGSTLTERGFVYALSSVSNIVIGEAGVTKVTNEVVEVGAFTNTLSGLSANTSYAVKAYAINGQGTNYSSSTLTFSTLQSNPTFTGVYTQDFTGVSNAATIPAGWRALSSSNLNTFAGTWSASANNGGFYTRTGTPGILGYLHTGSTGLLTNKLTLVNGTGGTLSSLFVSYKGEVNVTNNPRFPAFTVAVNGAEVPALAYSTEGGTNAALVTEVTGLNIAAGENIVITWSCDRGIGTGSSRLIGLTDVRVSTSAPNAAPTDIALSATSIAENNAVDGNVGTLSTTDPDSGDTFTYSLVAGTGDTDNGSFSIIGRSLQAGVAFDFETKSSYSIRVRTTDSGGATFEKAFTITVTDVVEGTTFAGWSGGATLNAANLAKYAIGGASSLTATDGQGTVQGGDASTLTLTAIVRTDDTTLTIAGEASTSLTNGWSTSGVTTSNAASQVGVPQGFTKKVYSVTRGVDERKFLRIRATK